jgi:hypothetical protein
LFLMMKMPAITATPTRPATTMPVDIPDSAGDEADVDVTAVALAAVPGAGAMLVGLSGVAVTPAAATHDVGSFSDFPGLNRIPMVASFVSGFAVTSSVHRFPFPVMSRAIVVPVSPAFAV